MESESACDGIMSAGRTWCAPLFRALSGFAGRQREGYALLGHGSKVVAAARRRGGFPPFAGSQMGAVGESLSNEALQFGGFVVRRTPLLNGDIGIVGQEEVFPRDSDDDAVASEL